MNLLRFAHKTSPFALYFLPIFGLLFPAHSLISGAPRIELTTSWIVFLLVMIVWLVFLLKTAQHRSTLQRNAVAAWARFTIHNTSVKDRSGKFVPTCSSCRSPLNLPAEDDAILDVVDRFRDPLRYISPK